MKKIITASLFSLSLFAEQSKVGLGSIYIEESYKGMDAKLMVLPYLSLYKNGFFIDGLQAGYKKAIDEQMSISFVLQGRLDGYKSTDSTYFAGMRDRDHAIDGGVVLSAWNSYGTIKASYLRDITGAHDGSEAGIEISKSYFFAKQIILTPSVKFSYRDKNLNNYYYGVRADEQTAARAYYEASAGVNYSAGASVAYLITPEISLFGKASYTRYSDEISNSPLIDGDGEAKAIVGVSYSF